jgi:predicted transposase/invertase (TIGR01784 family)
MSKSKTVKEVAPKVKKPKKALKKSTGKYINPLTDFGFKHIFGTKEYLIDFLNAVLKIKGGIVDLHYDNTVHPGRSEDDRTTIFDLYCTLENGERILIEMQLEPHGSFKPRILYYASRMIQEQGEGKKGDEWDYDLKAVYLVSIVNFLFDWKNQATDRYISYVLLMDKDTHRIFSRYLTFVFLELPRFVKEEDEISNKIEEWMFVLKNLARLNDLPEKLRTRVFESLFHKAEIAKLSKEDRRKYDKSVKNLLDMNIVIAEKNRKIETLTQNNASLTQNNASLTQSNAALQQKVEEYQRRYGALNN